MQRALAYALSPAPGMPLGFLLAAPWFGVLAALALFGAGDSAFVSRWSAPTLGATHLITLGYLGMTMAGAILQLIPVVTGVALPLSRVAAVSAWGSLAVGALLLAGALTFSASTLLVPAALLLAAAFTILVSVIAPALWRPASAGALPMVRGMRLAVTGLVVTVTFGVILALTLAGILGAPLLMFVSLHAAWGLVGWVGMLIAGVAFQVIPMFQSSQTYPAPVTRGGPWALFILLGAWSAATISAAAGAAPMAAPEALAALLGAVLTGFAGFTGWLLTRGKRKKPDATTLYWRLSLSSLAVSVVLYLAPPYEQAPLVIGIVFIFGFAMGAVNGMLLKIVPFLLWYHLQHNPAARKGEVPSMRVILPDAVARRQFFWHAAALAGLLGAVYWPVWLARPACALLGVSSLLLALDLGRAAASCRTIQRRFQPS
jgi:hypothetical protein